MEKYIWLNPVVLKMYKQEDLNKTLENLGFQIVTCEENHLETVKNKYKDQFAGCSGLLCDNRCPKAISYVKAHYDHPSLEYSAIKPILIHSAEELANRFKEEEVELYIITPCTDLRDLGIKLSLKNTIFKTWTEFCKDHQIILPSISAEKSPIPPGFFDNISNVVSLGSKDDIDRFFKESSLEENQLIEMLYCQGGCHNGDGVRIVND